MTTMTATAKARFLAKKSAEMKPFSIMVKEFNNRVNKGTNKAIIGVRIINPITLTTENWDSCCGIGFDLESGYVQYRFQVKLLIIAAIKENILASTAVIPSKDVSRLNVPKSTTAPNIPTAANFRKRERSRGLVTIEVSVIPNPFYF
jgi:hypothetical protein